MKTLNKKLVKQISKMLLVLLAFNLVATTGIKASAAEAATITYDVQGELKKGNTVDITVNANNVSELYGASFDFAYDPTIMTVESATQGTIFGSDKVSIPVKEIKSGSVEYALMLNGANSTAKAKTGSLVTLKVKLLKDATVTLKTSDSNAALSATGINCRVKLAKSGYQTSDIKYTAADKDIVIGDTIVINKSTLTNFTADKPSNVNAGTLVTLNATATPAADTLYEFYVRNGSGAWVKSQPYSNNNLFKWTAPSAGTYTVRVMAKHKNSTAGSDGYKDLSFVVTGKILSTVNTFTSDKASGQPVGSTIKFTATATPSTDTLYEFYVKPVNGSWKKIQSYSATNSCNWKPLDAGDYILRVMVKHKTSVNASDSYKDLNFNIKSNSNFSTLTNVAVDKVSGQPVGTTVKFTATANPSNSLYAFYVKEGNGQFVKVQGFGTNNVFNWKSTASGNYTIRVMAKHPNSTFASDTYKDISFIIK